VGVRKLNTGKWNREAGQGSNSKKELGMNLGSPGFWILMPWIAPRLPPLYYNSGIVSGISQLSMPGSFI
jgi:hypothetical protein